MFRHLSKTTVIFLATALNLALSSVSEAVTLNFAWKGQIAGFEVKG